MTDHNQATQDAKELVAKQAEIRRYHNALMELSAKYETLAAAAREAHSELDYAGGNAGRRRFARQILERALAQAPAGGVLPGAARGSRELHSSEEIAQNIVAAYHNDLAHNASPYETLRSNIATAVESARQEVHGVLRHLGFPSASHPPSASARARSCAGCVRGEESNHDG